MYLSTIKEVIWVSSIIWRPVPFWVAQIHLALRSDNDDHFEIGNDHHTKTAAAVCDRTKHLLITSRRWSRCAVGSSHDASGFPPNGICDIFDLIFINIY